MGDVRYPVLELRQYTLRPGQRDVLIDVFDREFVETQEAEGMAILGQFRDLDRPDRFVWLRGFADMASRARGLTSFYTSPAWKMHGPVANATMLDVSNVLLLRPVTPDSGFRPAGTTRPPRDAGQAEPPPSRLLVTICLRDRPFDDEFANRFDRDIRPELAAAEAAPLAWFQTEYAENDYPALPVRTGENAFVWFTLFPDEDRLTSHLDWLDGQDRLLDRLPGAPEQLKLAPTARSQLH
jgi:hypothetical protein